MFRYPSTGFVSKSPRAVKAGLLAAVALVVVVYGAAAVAAPPGTPPAAAADDGKIPPWIAKEEAARKAAASGRGAQIFTEVCAACHEHGVSNAPSTYILKIMTASSIYDALSRGAMRVQAQNLSDADKKAVAEYVAGSNIAGDSKLMPPSCTGAAANFDFSQAPAFSSWGITPTNTRHVDGGAAGLNAGNVGRLKLKWALGFEGAGRVRSQAALAGGAIYLGSQDGHVYALDRNSGCMKWRFQASAEVRTGVIVSPWKAGDSTAKPYLYFGDIVGNLYAIDAISGKEIWHDHVDAHPSTTLTATPVLHDGSLYVPVSSLEEGAAGAKYDCCTFRGSVVAYQAMSGKRLWETYMVGKPTYRGHDAAGSKAYGPSGIALWNTPAIDAKRGVMYFATGDNYSSPTTRYSDAVVAMDLKTGKIKWSYQALAKDAWVAGCSMPGPSSCPKDSGPDFDFGAAVMLVTGSNGQQYVVAGQKSGWVYALNPDHGTLVWKNKLGRGGIVAGVYFGMAAHANTVFVPINDAPDGRSYSEAAKPGLYALDLYTGKYRWKAPIGDEACKDRGPLCWPGIAAPVTATDDLVFSGAGDGRIRVYAADTGAILWQYDTVDPVTTVGGGIAHGGSMGGAAGQIPYGGNLIVESGYAFAGRMPGNVMLVFGVD